MSFVEDVFNIVNGVKSGVVDSVSLVGNVATGDVHGIVTDTRNLFGATGDVIDGLQGLGANLGPVPAVYAKSPFGKLSDSPILSGAQLAITAERALTGSGDPEQGNGYQESAQRLELAVEELVDAAPANDRWDGTASEVYEQTNNIHRRHTSNVQAADAKIAEILSIEADQVGRTRKTLDDTSQYLYDFGLSTAWMNYVPGLAVAKVAADTAAASAGLATANATMMVLAKNSVENALRIREWLDEYQQATEDTSGDSDGCGTFVAPEIDTADGSRPSRLDPGAEYTVPDPIEPPQYGPPATPYGAPR